MPGVVHGMRSYLMQDEHGQVEEAQSISAGLDYPGVGPEHSYLASIGRAEYPPVTDAEVLDAFQLLARTEGIISAFESAHAIAWLVREAPSLQGQTVLVCLSGRGDKDVAQAMELIGVGRTRPADVGRMEDALPRQRAPTAASCSCRTSPAGYPGWEDAVRAAAANGADGDRDRHPVLRPGDGRAR